MKRLDNNSMLQIKNRFFSIHEWATPHQKNDSLNCILLVNDADVGSNIVNVDKWIITLIHQENIDKVSDVTV